MNVTLLKDSANQHAVYSSKVLLVHCNNLTIFYNGSKFKVITVIQLTPEYYSFCKAILTVLVWIFKSVLMLMLMWIEARSGDCYWWVLEERRKLTYFRHSLQRADQLF